MKINISKTDIKSLNDEQLGKKVRELAAQAKETKTFIKPELEEVEEYVKQKGYSFDPIRFYAHYESNGWKVGKNSMKCWKSACVTWQLGRGTL